MPSKPAKPAAHTPRPGGSEWHDLVQHLRAVAAATARSAAKFDAAAIGYWAGILHDIGKFGEDFQRYLFACHAADRGRGTPPRAGSAPHAIHGAVVARSAYSGRYPLLGDTAQGGELAWPILNHHGGLQDLSRFEGRLVEGTNDPMVRRVIPEALKHLPELRDLAAQIPDVPEFESTHNREFFIRMLLSALVDADHCDTEAWRDPDKHAARGSDFAEVTALAETMRQNQQALTRNSKPTHVNVARQDICDAVLAQANNPTGFFKLTVPTGGGKTRTALSFALEHATSHKLERVVVAIPYTSIIEQSAAEYRKILGAEVVLEHHSAVHPNDDEADVLNWQKLAAENWNVPVVVTTTVQLFESLFANRTSKLRKLHNLARAVIVLDEVQTLPVRLLNPILDVLSELTTPRYGSSVVLCTATQPALNEDLGFPRLAGVRELAPDPEHYFKSLTRVEYDVRVDEPWSWQDVADTMRGAEQVLCVVNLKRHARELFEILDDPQALHLSTTMCPEHRRNVLAQVRERLSQSEPCRVVATQLVEAGVDVDFPFVLRSLGPLDSIVQAAGRCNREGNLERGRVIVFKPQDHKLPPGFYETATREAEGLLANGVDLNAAGVFDDYFRNLYLYLAERDAEGIQQLRGRFDYPTVAERFRMIDDDTEPVIVRKWAPDKVDALIARGINRFTLRALQPYIVTVLKAHTQRLEQLGFIARPSPTAEGIWLWLGDYDESFGIIERFDSFIL